MPAMNDSDLFWRDALTAAGFPVRDLKRCNAVARVISANKFRRLEQLGNAPSVETWACSDRLQEDELLQLQFFCTRQRGGSDDEDTADSPPSDGVSDGDSPPDVLHLDGARGARPLMISCRRFPVQCSLLICLLFSSVNPPPCLLVLPPPLSRRWRVSRHRAPVFPLSASRPVSRRT